MSPEPNRALIAGLDGPLAAVSLMVAWFVLSGTHWMGGYLIDGQGYILGRDFLNFWHYGIAAWRGDALSFYDLGFYNRVLDALIPGYDYPDQNWSYPPHYMLLAAPFGLLGYHPALALYTGLGLLLYWRVVVALAGGWERRLALMAMPTLVVCLLCGQVSALLAVVLVTIYRTLDRRPEIAGLMIALLTVKPQIGLLIPLFLILTGRWKVMFVATAATLAFVGLSAAWHGTDIWRHYLTVGISTQSTTLTESNVIVMGLMPTAFVDMVMLGAPRQAALAAQALFAAFAVAMLWLTIRATRDDFLRFAALVAASFVVTPYLMSYDTLVIGWVLIGLAARAEFSPAQAAIYWLAMILCPLGVVMALVGLPGAPLVLAAISWWVLAEARRGAAIAPEPSVVLNRATAR